MKWLKKKDKTLKTGMVFEKYTVERELGHGGMGMVYLVRHNMLDSHFAMKVLDSEIAGKNKHFVDRFIREAKLACKIRHPNLITVHDAGMNPGTGLYYIVMDYVPGGNVRDLLKAEGRIRPDRALEIIRQMAGALCAAYAHHMVHRDIKPDNIMFAVDGSAKLADLGIAKSTDEHDPTLTMAATVFGTPAYMSPEQARDSSQVDIRADIYSLGIVFYEMLSGQRPFNGPTPMSILSQVMGPQSVPDIRSVAPDVPQELAALIAEMTEKDLNRRIADPDTLLKKLNAIRLPARLNAPRAAASARSATPATGVPEVTIPTMAPTGTPEVTIPTMAPTGTPEVTLATVPPPEPVSVPEPTIAPEVTLATVPPPETVSAPEVTIPTMAPTGTPEVTLATVPPPEPVSVPEPTVAPEVTLATVPPPSASPSRPGSSAAQSRAVPQNNQGRSASTSARSAAAPTGSGASTSLPAEKSSSKETGRKKSGRALFLIAASFLILVCFAGGTALRFSSSNNQPPSDPPPSSDPFSPGEKPPVGPVLVPVYELQIVTAPDSNINLTSREGYSRDFLSDHEGTRVITDLRDGNYTVKISRDGYIPLDHSFTLNGDTTLKLPMTKSLEKGQIVLIAVDADYSRVVEGEMERAFGAEKVTQLVSEGLNGYEEQLDEIVGSEPSAVVLFLNGAVSNYDSFFAGHADVLKKKNIPFAFVLMPEDEDDRTSNKYNVAVLDLIRKYDFTLIRAEDLSSDIAAFKTEHNL